MGFRTSFLILLLLLPCAAMAAPKAPSCLKCHPEHYASLGGCVDCHGGDPRTDRPDIAHHALIAGRFAHFTLAESPVVRQGRDLMEKLACRRCHLSGGKGNRLAADLDALPSFRLPEEMFDAIRKPAAYMPDFHLDDGRIDLLINAIYAGARETPPRSGEQPLVIHFETEGEKENAFVKHCGGCHRMMTLTLGGLGSGETGPNLSGLLTTFYPKTFGKGESWTVENVEKWVKNPRVSRPTATMMPVKLTDKEWRDLLEVLRASGVPGGAEGEGSGLPGE